MEQGGNLFNGLSSFPSNRGRFEMLSEIDWNLFIKNAVVHAQVWDMDAEASHNPVIVFDLAQFCS